MSSVSVRDASTADVIAIAAIGRAAMPAQYEGLVDPAAVEAAVDQTYSEIAIWQSIDRCTEAGDAYFLVAELSGSVVGFLHFDCFGPEPELHRLYVDATQRGGGIGALLMKELHSQIGPTKYMLLVVEGNDRAIRFYEREGLAVGELVDGLTYYRDRMGVVFPSNTLPFRLVLMRRDFF